MQNPNLLLSAETYSNKRMFLPEKSEKISLFVLDYWFSFSSLIILNNYVAKIIKADLAIINLS